MTAGTVLNTYTPELRNLIVNGNMDFWQRGTSFLLSPTVKQYIADRFFFYFNLANYPTAGQVADAPTVAQSNWQSRYCIQIGNSSSASTPTGTQIAYLAHRIEGQDYQAIHGRKARLQFWVKSGVAGTYGIYFANSGYTRSYLTTYTITSANAWQQVSIDLSLDSAGTWNFDNTIGLEIGWVLCSASGFQSSTLNAWQTTTGQTVPSGCVNWAGTPSATFEITQVAMYPVQANSGTTFPFVRCGRSIGDELNLCQRYYETSYVLGTAPGTSGNVSAVCGIQLNGMTASTGVITSCILFKTSKRITPSTSSQIATWDLSGNGGFGSSSRAAYTNPSQLTNQAVSYDTQVSDKGFAISSDGTTSKNGMIFYWACDVDL